MKTNSKYIQIIVLIILVVFLYGFSSGRNAKREQKINISFTNGKHLFITKETVNNLLITKSKTPKKQPQDSITLYSLENKLDKYPMIAKSQVFKTITGGLNVEVTQRQPIARSIGADNFYIDSKGGMMPLSDIYSARVPLISGISEEDIDTIYPLLHKINNDDFLTKHITSIHKDNSGDYILQLRNSIITINFGKIIRIDGKIKNFKAFYKKALIDKKLDYYSHINLKFANQVVCTKKES